MARITRNEVEKIAALARLSLTLDEVAGMERDLGRILGYVGDLAELDTSGIAPTAHAIALGTPLRPDEALPGMRPEDVVANAPESAGTAFLVPKVVEEEGS